VGPLVNVNPGANAAFSGLTIANASNISTGTGGGMHNAGTLAVSNSTFANNSAGYSAAAHGGGIYNAGTLAVSNSTFANNSASGGGGLAHGGGIWNQGNLMVGNSTFSGNSAGTGGGIFNDGAGLAVTNSTFSGNSASDGGGIANGGTLTLTNSILTNDAGGECEGSGCPSSGSNGNVVGATTPPANLTPLGACLRIELKGVRV
jgi:hypothetical protein